MPRQRQSLEPPAKVPLLSVKVTVELSLPTTLPNASSTLTVTAGVMVAPAAVFVGCCPKTILLAAAGLTVMLLDGTEVRPPPLNVSVIAPAVSSSRPANVATPSDTVAVVPWSMPAPLANVAVITVELSPTSRLPYAILLVDHRCHGECLTGRCRRRRLGVDHQLARLRGADDDAPTMVPPSARLR